MHLVLAECKLNDAFQRVGVGDLPEQADDFPAGETIGVFEMGGKSGSNARAKLLNRQAQLFARVVTARVR